MDGINTNVPQMARAAAEGIITAKNPLCRVHVFLHWDCFEDFLHQQLSTETPAVVAHVMGSADVKAASRYILRRLQTCHLFGWSQQGQMFLYDPCVGKGVKPLARQDRRAIGVGLARDLMAMLVEDDLENRVQVTFLESLVGLGNVEDLLGAFLAS